MLAVSTAGGRLVTFVVPDRRTARGLLSRRLAIDLEAAARVTGGERDASVAPSVTATGSSNLQGSWPREPGLARHLDRRRSTRVTVADGERDVTLSAMAGRSLSCAKCGAQAPELSDDQRSFVCTYCRAQTFVDPPVAPSETPSEEPPISEPAGPPVRPFRPQRPRWLGLVPVALVIVVMAIIMANVTRGPASELVDCRTFRGTPSRATWSGCPSKATREIACKSTFALPGVPAGARPPGFDSLTCDCLRDGAQTWFFEAASAPPLESRESAERVAAASCKMW